MKTRNNLASLPQDDRFLRRAVLFAFLAVIGTAVIFAAYYYWDRYVFLGDQSPLESGVSELENSIRTDPDNVENRLALAQFYYDSAAYEDAAEQARQVLDAYPENDTAMYLLGMARYQSGAIESAIEYLEQFTAVRRLAPMARNDKTLEAALYFLGESYLRLEQPEAAIPVLEEALQINATDADAMYKLGVANALTGQHETAIAQYVNAVRFVPDFTEAYRGMMDSYTAMNQPDYVAYARGMEAFSQKDYQTAQIHLQSAADNLPEFAPAHVGLALVLEQVGDLQGAANELQMALALEPDNFLATYSLGRIQQLLEQSGASNS